MLPFRRQFVRLLRLRNILAVTITVVVFYYIKILQNDYHQEIGNEARKLLKKKYDYFVPYSLKKIDWHDHEMIKAEKMRVGTGEQGKPATNPPDQIIAEKDLYAVNGFNGLLSDNISLVRSLPDIRHEGCMHKKYIENLPVVSVVVPFHNEHESTLLRTAMSVLHRSPAHLIKEVFLVDDASTKDFLKEKLDIYLEKNMPKVKVVRVKDRSGLITARLAGAKVATGDVLVFLDSHTEVNVNWLPPLLEPIALNYRVAVCPFIDVIAYDTFEYRAQDNGARGAFDWEFFYKRLPLLPKDLENMPEPFDSPVMAGGLFAISRAFFWELGGYDPGLDIWGGEQYELSFKIWQCGGRMVDAPCSRVGHIYRKFAPFPNPGHGDFVGKNYRRVAEVWMDEYAEYLYNRRPQYREINPGDISEQKARRQELHCKSFKWFMTYIAFDLIDHYPPVEPEPFAHGQIRPILDKGFCLDAHNGAQNDKLELNNCKTSDNAEQVFVLSWHKDIKLLVRSICWDLPESASGSPVILYQCHLGGGNQKWRYQPSLKSFRHRSNVCLDFDETTKSLFVSPCTGVKTQMWQIDHVEDDIDQRYEATVARITGPIE